MAKTIKPMTSGSIWKQMTLFALPIFFGNLFQQLYNTVDSLIVGNYLGSNALAAVSSSGSLIFMMIGFLGGVASGAGVVVSRFFGAGDNERLEAAVHTTVAVGLISGVVMTIFGMVMTPRILVWMGTPESVMPESTTYLTLYFSGSMAFIMYNILVGILQAVGDSRHPLYYLIISSVVNLILDLWFIAGLGFGVGGAAVATVISQFLSAFLCLFQLMRTNDSYKLRLSRIRLDGRMLRQIVGIGLPSGFQNSVIAFANVIVQSNVNSFGAMAMAGYGAYSKIEGFGFLPITSFNLALTTFVGQNLGAKQYDRTRKGARFGILAAVISAEIIGIITFIFAPQLIAAFDSNPEVILFGVEKAKTASLFFFLLAFSHSMASVLRGAGKAMVPMVVMLAIWCVFRVSFLTVTIALTHSIWMVYIVYPLTWAMSSIAFLIYYRHVDWMHASAKAETV